MSGRGSAVVSHEVGRAPPACSAALALSWTQPPPQRALSPQQQLLHAADRVAVPRELLLDSSPGWGHGRPTASALPAATSVVVFDCAGEEREEKLYSATVREMRALLTAAFAGGVSEATAELTASVGGREWRLRTDADVRGALLAAASAGGVGGGGDGGMHNRMGGVGGGRRAAALHVRVEAGTPPRAAVEIRTTTAGVEASAPRRATTRVDVAGTPSPFGVARGDAPRRASPPAVSAAPFPSSGPGAAARGVTAGAASPDPAALRRQQGLGARAAALAAVASQRLATRAPHPREGAAAAAVGARDPAGGASPSRALPGRKGAAVGAGGSPATALPSLASPARAPERLGGPAGASDGDTAGFAPFSAERAGAGEAHAGGRGLGGWTDRVRGSMDHATRGSGSGARSPEEPWSRGAEGAVPPTPPAAGVRDAAAVASGVRASERLRRALADSEPPPPPPPPLSPSPPASPPPPPPPLRQAPGASASPAAGSGMLARDSARDGGERLVAGVDGAGRTAHASPPSCSPTFGGGAEDAGDMYERFSRLDAMVTATRALPAPAPVGTGSRDRRAPRLPRPPSGAAVPADGRTTPSDAPPPPPRGAVEPPAPVPAPVAAAAPSVDLPDARAEAVVASSQTVAGGSPRSAPSVPVIDAIAGSRRAPVDVARRSGVPAASAGARPPDAPPTAPAEARGSPVVRDRAAGGGSEPADSRVLHVAAEGPVLLVPAPVRGVATSGQGAAPLWDVSAHLAEPAASVAAPVQVARASRSVVVAGDALQVVSAPGGAVEAPRAAAPAPPADASAPLPAEAAALDGHARSGSATSDAGSDGGGWGDEAAGAQLSHNGRVLLRPARRASCASVAFPSPTAAAAGAGTSEQVPTPAGTGEQVPTPLNATEAAPAPAASGVATRTVGAAARTVGAAAVAPSEQAQADPARAPAAREPARVAVGELRELAEQSAAARAMVATTPSVDAGQPAGTGVPADPVGAAGGAGSPDPSRGDRVVTRAGGAVPSAAHVVPTPLRAPVPAPVVRSSDALADDGPLGARHVEAVVEDAAPVEVLSMAATIAAASTVTRARPTPPAKLPGAATRGGGDAGAATRGGRDAGAAGTAGHVGAAGAAPAAGDAVARVGALAAAPASGAGSVPAAGAGSTAGTVVAAAERASGAGDGAHSVVSAARELAAADAPSGAPLDAVATAVVHELPAAPDVGAASPHMAAARTGTAPDAAPVVASAPLAAAPGGISLDSISLDAALARAVVPAARAGAARPMVRPKPSIASMRRARSGTGAAVVPSPSRPAAAAVPLETAGPASASASLLGGEWPVAGGAPESAPLEVLVGHESAAAEPVPVGSAGAASSGAAGVAATTTSETDAPTPTRVAAAAPPPGRRPPGGLGAGARVALLATRRSSSRLLGSDSAADSAPLAVAEAAAVQVVGAAPVASTGVTGPSAAAPAAARPAGAVPPPRKPSGVARRAASSSDVAPDAGGGSVGPRGGSGVAGAAAVAGDGSAARTAAGSDAASANGSVLSAERVAALVIPRVSAADTRMLGIRRPQHPPPPAAIAAAGGGADAAVGGARLVTPRPPAAPPPEGEAEMTPPKPPSRA